MSQLTTPLFRGNGVFQDAAYLGEISNPELQVVDARARPSAVSQAISPPTRQTTATGLTESIYEQGPLIGPFTGGRISVNPYNWIYASDIDFPLISSQSGVGILGLALTNIKLSPWDLSLYEGCILYKCGWDLGQWLPTCGLPSTLLNEESVATCFPTMTTSIVHQFLNQPNPVTTNAKINSSLLPALSTVFGAPSNEATPSPPPQNEQNTSLPGFNLGICTTTASTESNSASIVANRLAEKSTTPFLCLRSSIQRPCGAQFMGGLDQNQLLPVIASLSMDYAASDFWYVNKSDLIFEVTSPYILSSITTQVTFPDGRLASPILGDNSAVIYRIDRMPSTPS